MGFWIATSDAAGVRIVGSELLLQPGPSKAGYPDEEAGTLIATDDGGAVHQQPSLDNRVRTWEWLGYTPTQEGYKRVWPTLEGLRSRYRKEAGLCPYIFLREDITDGLKRRFTLTLSGSGSGFTFTTTGLTANALIGGSITIGGQVRGILANTTTVISVGDAFIGAVSGTAKVMHKSTDWFRARVISVPRVMEPGGGMGKYDVSLMSFVIDDPNSIDLVG